MSAVNPSAEIETCAFVGLFPGKAHRAKENTAILKPKSQKSFEQNVLQNFHQIQ